MSFGHPGDAGNVVDHPATMDLAFNVGKLILNFGTIETRMIELAEIVSRDSDNYQKALSLPFRRRVALVRKLTKKSKLQQKLKSQLLTALSRAEGLAMIRNDLAHNPCILVWKKGSDKAGPPDAIHIPLMKTIKGKTTRAVRTIDIEGVKRAVDQTAAGGAELSRIRDAVKLALG